MFRRAVAGVCVAVAGLVTAASSGYDVPTPAISPHLGHDPNVRVSATCVLGERKFKCGAPLPRDGALPRWGNVSGTLYALSSWDTGKQKKSAASAFACRSVPRAPTPGAIALVQEGRCSLAQKARRLKKGGWEGAILSPGQRFKASKKQKRKQQRKTKQQDDALIELPLVTVTKATLKQLVRAALTATSAESAGLGAEDAAATTARIVLAARRGDGVGASAQWKTAGTLYQEAKKAYLAGDTTGAVRSINASLKLDARALPAHYTLANYACDLGDTEGAKKLLRGIMPPPPQPASEKRKKKNCDAAEGARAAATAGAATGRHLRVVTVATNPRAELTMLRHSVERNGLKLEVLGLGETYSGLGFKIVKMWEFLSERKRVGDDSDGEGKGKFVVPDDDVILFTDAYDVVFTGACGTADEFMRRFDRVGASVLLGGELELNPDYSLALLLPEYNHTKADKGGNGTGIGCPAVSPAFGNGDVMRAAARASAAAAAGGGSSGSLRFPFLNSGTYMGRAADLRLMFEAVLRDIEAGYGSTGGDPAHLNDQRWFYRYLLAQPGHATLDRDALIFHTLHWTEVSDFELLGESDAKSEQAARGVVRSRLTGGEPCLLHGNGDDGKLVLDAFFTKLANVGFLPRRAAGSTKYGGW